MPRRAREGRERRQRGLRAIGWLDHLTGIHPHYAGTAAEETLIQVHRVGPTDVTFVNPADDPRKK